MHALGVDVGSTNTKVSLVHVPDRGGTRPVEVDLRSAPTPAGADELVATVLRLVTETLAQASAVGVRVETVGVASMAETGVPLDDRDRPLTRLLRWTSGAGQAQVRSLTQTYGAQALFAATGVRPAPKSPLVTWLRLAAEAPEVWRRMRRWAGAADLVALALTGELVTDHTLAGRTMAYRLPPADEPLPEGFAPDLLAVAGLRPQQVPRVLLPGAALPGVTAPDFVAAGLLRGTPVTVAGHDHQVGAWAAGVRAAGHVADSVGTAESLVQVLATVPERDGEPHRPAVAAAGMSLVRTVDGAPALVAGSGSAGALVSWWCAQLARRGVAELDLDVLAEENPDPAGPLVLPYLAGRQSPYPDPGARLGVVAGDGSAGPVESLLHPDTAAEGCRALLAGLCLQVRWTAAEQRRLSRLPPTRVTVVGGPGGRGRWLNTKADVLAQGVDRVRAGEPVATGAALLAAHRSGVDRDRTVLAVEPVSQPGSDPWADRWAAAAVRFERAALRGTGLPSAPSEGR